MRGAASVAFGILLALVVMLMLSLASMPAAAEPRQPPSKAEQARKVKRHADRLTRENPHLDPTNQRFYTSPWTNKWVLNLCRGPAPRPRSQVCAAAFETERLNGR